MKGKELVGAVCLHAAVLALAVWAARGGYVWPVVAAAGAVSGALLYGRRSRTGAWAGVLLLLGVTTTLAAQWHLHRLAVQWPDRAEALAERLQVRAIDELEALLEEGEEATLELVERWERDALPPGPTLPRDLLPGRAEAVALFGPGGSLLAWVGSHQGPFPEDVRLGVEPHLYREGPLFGYLYVTRALEGARGTVVAAYLVREDLPPALESPAADFSSRFQRATGARVLVSRWDRPMTGEVRNLVRDGRPVLQVAVEPPSEADVREGREIAWIRAVALLLLAGWLLAVLGVRRGPVAAAFGGATLPLILVLLPLGRITGWAPAFSPADFLLPGPVGLTVGDLLALGLGGAVVAGLLAWNRLPRLPAWAAALGGGLLATAVLAALREGASRDFLAGSEAGWVAFQGTGTILVALAFALALLPGGESRGREGRGQALGLVGTVGFALAMGLGASVLARRDPALPSLLALAWTLPLWGLARTLPREAGWWNGAIRWVTVAVVAGSLVLPWAWGLRVEARMAMAEERVERLGARPDPFLEFLLLRAGQRAQELGAVGREPVELLYRAWTEGGLAWEGVPLWLTYWSADGRAREELRVGVGELRPPVPPVLRVEAAATGEPVIRRFEMTEAHYMAAAFLPGGEGITIVVPPRRSLVGASPFGPLFSPAQVEPDPLALIPLAPGQIPGHLDEIRWVRTPEGWQAEVYLEFPDDLYHAHYHLHLPGPLLRVARGSLLLLLNASILVLFWGVGRGVGAGFPGRIAEWSAALGSFRGRVTLALFAFFLIPSVLFGTLAYRTLSGAAVRTAEALAERAVEDAVAWYHDVGGAMDVLARRVGSDLLRYEGGELVEGSSRELVALGLYEGWLPPEIHRDMAEGEEVMTTAVAALGGWEYVVAYRQVARGRVLAAPAPLQAGATALRQREIADLLGFAVVLGGIFSVLLAFLVGRALTRPIQTLRVASERVGSGNMEVHLPSDRRDEFGTVFEAFNRMVDRLSAARRELLASSRRTRAIVEEVATGVVALGPDGRVLLVNPRAEELLGVAVPAGEPLPRGPDDEDPRAFLASWVQSCYRDRVREAATEISVDGRRIRVRATRIARRGAPEGAVLSLEDVTDELRTERILAWGEMARQVAHEVKNPLTPIKLGIQHVLRAWDDDRDDFGRILHRNAEAILGEIDRLSSIASSFSRYGAPGPAESEPLEAVEVEAVVGEALDLYRAADVPVSFHFRGSRGLPPARARPRELKEVLVNLLENARAHVPDGGVVQVEARTADGGVEIRVADDGPGIPDEVLPRVFEPHFSTRSGGSGLGLAIVRRLVESWGGRAEVEGTSGEGTTIRIWVPAWDGEGGGGDGTGAAA